MIKIPKLLSSLVAGTMLAAIVFAVPAKASVESDLATIRASQMWAAQHGMPMPPVPAKYAGYAAQYDSGYGYGGYATPYGYGAYATPYGYGGFSGYGGYGGYGVNTYTYPTNVFYDGY